MAATVVDAALEELAASTASKTVVEEAGDDMVVVVGRALEEVEDARLADVVVVDLAGVEVLLEDDVVEVG